MKLRIATLLVFLVSLAGIARADQNKTDVIERLQDAGGTLRNLTEAGDRGIPDEVLKGAKCIGVVPSMIKGAFIFGGKHGRGVATCRLPDGRWSAPAFFTITGGSWGLQIGVEDVQLVLMIMTDEGMRHLLSDKFQVGAGAEGAAGPVGRHAEAGVDWKVDTQILSYSKAKGLFAGINIDGSWIEQDKDSTVAFYGKEYGHNEILTGRVQPPASARNFLAEVRRAEIRGAEHRAAKAS
jgi:lipid-binding SYLF domain-containing protein